MDSESARREQDLLQEIAVLREELARERSRARGEACEEVAASRDAAELNWTEDRLYKLNRTLKALHSSTHALLHASSEEALLKDVCNIVVEDCGYAMVWIGFAEEDEAKTVRPVACAGYEDGYLQTLNVTWADTERGRGPTGTSIRTGQPCACLDMHADPNFEPWREQALKRGYVSSLVLPLLADGKAFGAITIYSTQSDPFSSEEVSLLKDLANDLAYGIVTLRLRAAHERAEQALRSSEMRYRSLFMSMTEGFYISRILYDESGKPCDYLFEEVNPAFERIVGRSRDEIIGRQARELVPNLSSQWLNVFTEVALTGKSVEFDFYSEIFEKHFETFSFRLAETRFAVLVVDATERKRAEQALRVSEARYRALFEGMTEGFALHEIICDESGVPSDYRFLEINPAFERLTGLAREQVLGKRYRELFSGDDPTWVRIYGEVALTGKSARFDNYFPELKRHYEVTAYRPAPLQFAVLFTDITERKRLEEDLLQSGAREKERVAELGTVLEALPTVVWIAHDPDCLHITGNRAADELLRLRKGEEASLTAVPDTRPMHFKALQDGRELTGDELPVQRAARGEEIRDFELTLAFEDGSLRHLVGNATPLFGEGGEVRGSVAAFRDVTEGKRTEREREIAVKFLNLVNRSSGTRELIREAVQFLQEQSGCEAVGIRLKKDGDYPYYEARGFPKEFIQAENELCARDDRGGVLRDGAGDPVLECMCGNVICGRFDPSRDFFTPQGSFWTNCTTRLLAATGEADRQARTRNRCNGEGYEAVALIPLRMGRERLGLLQLNDRREGVFSPQRIAFWERMAGHLSVALSKFAAEEELREQGERLREALHLLQSHMDNTPLAVVEWNADFVVTRWGGAAARILGWTAEEAVGKRLDALNMVYEEDLPKVEEIMSAMLDGSRPSNMNANRNYRKDRSVIHCEWYNSALYGEDGSLASVLSLVLDVTERKRLERDLREAKEIAEEANRAKSDFLAQMSHEIRTPMNGIIGMTELALMEDLPPKAADYLELVKRSSKSLLDIVNDILDIAKIESGKAELLEENFDLRESFSTVLSTMGTLAARKGLDFQYNVAPEVPRLVRGDRGRLGQVLANLVGNAVKFTETGSVAVEVKLSEDARAPAGRLRLLCSVRDTGVGIAPDKLETIFDPFTQAGGASHHARYGGTGLGLTICRQLVQLMGGAIEVESEPGAGSTFRFTAEVGASESAALPEAVPVEEPLTARPSRLRILLAEDNAINQIVGREFLESDGHSVTVAGNGRLVLEALAREPFDLVLMDVRMPEIDGLEATRRIREGSVPGVPRDIPVIALTAHALRGDRERFMAAGMDDYISKPIDLDELYRVLAGIEERTKVSSDIA